jgi:hypothetical protein
MKIIKSLFVKQLSFRRHILNGVLLQLPFFAVCLLLGLLDFSRDDNLSMFTYWIREQFGYILLNAAVFVIVLLPYIAGWITLQMLKRYLRLRDNGLNWMAIGCAIGLALAVIDFVRVFLDTAIDFGGDYKVMAFEYLLAMWMGAAAGFLIELKLGLKRKQS